METRDKRNCIFCDKKMKIILRPLKDGSRKSSHYKCEECGRKVYKPLRISVTERKLFHKELFETYRFIMTGMLGIFVAIAIANFNLMINDNPIFIHWHNLIIIAAYSLFMTALLFNRLFENVRREIEMLEEFSHG